MRLASARYASDWSAFLLSLKLEKSSIYQFWKYVKCLSRMGYMIVDLYSAPFSFASVNNCAFGYCQNYPSRQDIIDLYCQELLNCTCYMV